MVNIRALSARGSISDPSLVFLDADRANAPSKKSDNPPRMARIRMERLESREKNNSRNKQMANLKYVMWFGSIKSCFRRNDTAARSKAM